MAKALFNPKHLLEEDRALKDEPGANELLPTPR